LSSDSSAACAPVAISAKARKIDFIAPPPLIPVKHPVMPRILAHAQALEQVAHDVWRRPFVAD
jgi:hypothetical protein